MAVFLLPPWTSSAGVLSLSPVHIIPNYLDPRSWWEFTAIDRYCHPSQQLSVGLQCQLNIRLLIHRGWFIPYIYNHIHLRLDSFSIIYSSISKFVGDRDAADVLDALTTKIIQLENLHGRGLDTTKKYAGKEFAGDLEIFFEVSFIETKYVYFIQILTFLQDELNNITSECRAAVEASDKLLRKLCHENGMSEYM